MIADFKAGNATSNYGSAFNDDVVEYAKRVILKPVSLDGGKLMAKGSLNLLRGKRSIYK